MDFILLKRETLQNVQVRHTKVALNRRTDLDEVVQYKQPKHDSDLIGSDRRAIGLIKKTISLHLFYICKDKVYGMCKFGLMPWHRFVSVDKNLRST